MTNEAVEMEPSGRVLPIFRGEYDADRTYENPDIVLFRNSSYVAKQVTVGNPPPTDALADDYWQMVAKGIIDADVSDSTIEFTEATKRSNIESGEKSNIIMGKIMKFFTDLKDIAFSGRYSDLSDKPISITEDGNDSIISLEGGEQRSIGLINQLQAVNFKNEGGGPNQGMKFVTRQPSTGDIVFGNLDGDTDLMFPFSFGIDENGDYGYKKFKTNKFTPFGNVYTKNVLNTTEQISANTASGNIAGALAAKAMMADYNAKINQINSKLSAKNPFSIALKRDYDYKTASGWKCLLSWNDNNGRTGYLQENVSDGKITLYLTNERGDILINGNSVAQIVNNINNLKSSRTWNVILAAQADGTHEIPALDGTEALLMLGYVYRIQATMTIPMNIFKTARGEGGKILFEGLTIEVVDDTHTKVTGLTNNYLFRVFVR